MNKNSACALFVGLVTLFSCSDEKLFNPNASDVKGKMTMNAKVVNSDGASTRASFDDVTASTWVFNFQTNDVVKVNNTENSTYCTFTKTEETFVSSDAMPTTATSTWYAYFPSENINLSNQAGTPESIANLYALAGLQADVPGGTQSLSIELAAKSSILKIDNQVGEINIRVKDADGKFISGLKADNGEYTVTSGTTSTTLLSATEVGTYYVIVPSAQKIDIYNGDVKIKGTKEAGLTAGKCYSISIVPEYVDLGLPSGTLWATCNVGASSPEQYGYYYAWGETTPKTRYSWEDYTLCNGTNRTMKKYCCNNMFGVDDGLKELENKDDAAYVNVGEKWAMPTYEQVCELVDTKNTKSEWTTYKGVNGRLITSLINGKSIFLPASGSNFYSSASSVGSNAYYWTKTVDHIAYSPSYDCARIMYVSQYSFNADGNMNRNYGLVIRPVRKTHEYVDLGLSVKWATMNVGATEVAGTKIHSLTGKLDCYGEYYAWGEISGCNENISPYSSTWTGSTNNYYLNLTKKDPNRYSWTFYKWGGSSYFYKYDKGDSKNTLDSEDDAAHANWGGKWRMPTKAEYDELLKKCYWVWSSNYNNSGVEGFIVYKQKKSTDTGLTHGSSVTYSLSDTHIFLPAAGYDGSSGFTYSGWGFYWSSSLYTSVVQDGYHLKFKSNQIQTYDSYRCYGYPIRAVCP